jgi:hypothetical protein
MKERIHFEGTINSLKKFFSDIFGAIIEEEDILIDIEDAAKATEKK